MLEKIKVLKKIEIIESGHIQIQYAWRIMENGAMLAETYERTVKHVHDDLENEEDKIKELGKLKNFYPEKQHIAITGEIRGE